ncbi:MAG: hypothetical protein OEZ68_15750 [Gammaproteobacteria bacterium]|nr:hypothetical protein [Gammaproteobacteria bacterium]MDH5802255.1 hypothetical protein [Gammaproteobacteria bacterium]
MLKFIFGFIPVPVFIVHSLKHDWQAGVSYGLFVLIRQGYEHDEGLIEHELVHCKQFYFVSFFFLALMVGLGAPVESLPLCMLAHPVLTRVPIYRYWIEVFAYRKQSKFTENPFMSSMKYAERIKKLYGLPESVTKNVVEDIL